MLMRMRLGGKQGIRGSRSYSGGKFRMQYNHYHIVLIVNRLYHFQIAPYLICARSVYVSLQCAAFPILPKTSTFFTTSITTCSLSHPRQSNAAECSSWPTSTPSAQITPRGGNSNLWWTWGAGLGLYLG